MDLPERIERLKEKTKVAIKDALRSDDEAAVVAYSANLRRIRDVEERIAEAAQLVDMLERSFDKVMVNAESHQVADAHGLSRKAIGKLRRDKFVEEIKRRGMDAHLQKGQLASVEDKPVGIAWASERQVNKWFLGLPELEYHAVVLLCEDDSGHVTTLILPEAFYKEYRKDFSRDEAKGQIKFNVSRSAGKFELKLPGRDAMNMTSYMNKFENLK